jgi:hypothetical protein
MVTIPYQVASHSETPTTPRLRALHVATIGNDIVVTYVLDPPGQQLPTAGPGFGYVDIFSTTGQLLQRLEHGPG